MFIKGGDLHLARTPKLLLGYVGSKLVLEIAHLFIYTFSTSIYLWCLENLI